MILTINDLDLTIHESKQYLTKDEILSKVSEENIMEYYTGIPVKKGNFKSPLRSDSHPTCSYFRNRRGDLILNDFSGDFYGNCIAVVQRMFGVNYGKALQIIANDFGIKESNIEKNKCKIKKFTNIKMDHSESIIDIKLKEFTDNELKWWKSFHISRETLSKFKVFSCSAVFLNGELYSYPTNNSFNFCYFHPNSKSEKKMWKVYYPQNRKNRFMGNYTGKILQGSHVLPKEGYGCIITKSLKDVMVLHELNLISIAPNSESILISDAQVNILRNRYKNLIMFYDFDLAGVRTANKFKKIYPEFKVIFLQRKWSKDISDLGKSKGKSVLLEAGEEIKKIINGEIISRKTKYFYVF